jgi:hypothetical protein
MLKYILLITYFISSLFILPNLVAYENTDSSKVVSVLFIGNSLTYVNNLPELVKIQAEKKGVILKTEMIAFPNYALEDHWNDGEIQKKISTGKFEYVVIQQGPSSQSDGREMLMDYGKRIQQLCKESKSKLAFFMVWPSVSNWNTFSGVIKNYSDAAKSVNSILCPVGIVWKTTVELQKDYSLYDSDLFHPSKKGSELAAKVIVQALFLEKLK